MRLSPRMCWPAKELPQPRRENYFSRPRRWNIFTTIIRCNIILQHDRWNIFLQPRREKRVSQPRTSTYWINSQSRWQKCKWYKFVMINDKSLTAFTSCTSPGSLITEHGSSILSLRIENQPKSSTRKMNYWLPNIMLLTRPTCTDIPVSTPYSSSGSNACTFQHQGARAKAQYLMKNRFAFVFWKRESNHKF